MVGGQHHASAASPTGKTRYPLYRRLGGPRGRSGRVRKISPPLGIFFLFVRILCCIVLVLDFQWPYVLYRTEGCGFFRLEKSDGFGRERTRDLGHQRPACKPLDDRSKGFDLRTVQPVASRYTDWATRPAYYTVPVLISDRNFWIHCFISINVRRCQHIKLCYGMV
jgi:hypothetical protein